MRNYSAIRKNKILPSVPTHKDLESILQSEKKADGKRQE